jgi:hypothetical protein
VFFAYEGQSALGTFPCYCEGIPFVCVFFAYEGQSALGKIDLTLLQLLPKGPKMHQFPVKAQQKYRAQQ